MYYLSTVITNDLVRKTTNKIKQPNQLKARFPFEKPANTQENALVNILLLHYTFNIHNPFHNCLIVHLLKMITKHFMFVFINAYNIQSSSYMFIYIENIMVFSYQ